MVAEQNQPASQNLKLSRVLNGCELRKSLPICQTMIKCLFKEWLQTIDLQIEVSSCNKIVNLIFVVTKENCIVIRETANLLNNQQELNCNIVQIVKVTETVK